MTRRITPPPHPQEDKNLNMYMKVVEEEYVLIVSVLNRAQIGG
jgi:hypothetical protein